MSAVGPFRILHQRVDAIPKSQQAAINVATLVFALIAFGAELLGAREVDDEELTVCRVPVVETVYTELENGVRPGGQQIRVSCGRCSLDDAVADQSSYLLNRVDRHF
jgi:hypothetical protein